MIRPIRLIAATALAIVSFNTFAADFDLQSYAGDYHDIGDRFCNVHVEVSDNLLIETDMSPCDGAVAMYECNVKNGTCKIQECNSSSTCSRGPLSIDGNHIQLLRDGNYIRIIPGIPRTLKMVRL